MSKRHPASLGRRLLPAVAMTTAASGLVALLDRPSSGIAVGSGAAALPDQGAVAAGGQPPTVSSTLPAAIEQTPTTAAPTPKQPAPQPVPTTAAPAAVDNTPTVASGACAGKTIDGPNVSTQWGPVQVEAVVSATGQICDVTAIRSPNDRRKSVRINQNALPILHTQVLKAQSTTIRGVSGATVTSDGYVRSLQAILDGLGR